MASWELRKDPLEVPSRGTSEVFCPFHSVNASFLEESIGQKNYSDFLKKNFFKVCCGGSELLSCPGTIR